MNADWSILPSDPLGVIALKFDFYEDFIRFSAVCKGWNRASSLVKHQWRASLPSLLLSENTKENPDCLRKIFSLNDNQFYELNLPETFGTRCWGSAYGWVAIGDSKRNVQLFNPVTKAQIHFPSLKNLDNYPTPDYDYENDASYLKYCLFKLVVLKVSRNDYYEFIIVVIYNYQGPQYYNTALAFARRGDESWTSISVKEYKFDSTGRLITKIVDVVAIGDDIFALYGDGAIVHWNALEFYNRELLIPIDYSPPCSLDMFSRFEKGQVEKYLVELHGHLILVVRYKEEIRDIHDHGKFFYRTNAFDVFKLNEDKRWEKNEDLGDVALFVGCNYSMSISLGGAQSSQYSGIYFSDDECDYWGYALQGGRDLGFYDSKKREMQYYKYDDEPCAFCPAIWFISGQL